MDLGPHANFILLAYAAAAFVLAALVIWVAADHRAQMRALAALEAKGVGRRSGASPAMSASPARRRLLFLIPFTLFAALAALLFFRLGAGDPSRLPSVLIGKPAPALTLPPLAGADMPGLQPENFKGRVTLVNVWASWCAPCRDEHPYLMRLAKDTRLTVVGINYKDGEANARAFLARFGNPFRAVGIDTGGRAAIEWGVYGVPETFLVGRDATILYKHIGPIDERSFAVLLRQIEKAN